MIYDGRCSFCRLWLDYAKVLTGDGIEWITSQDLGDRFPQVPRETLPESVVLIAEDRKVHRGADAAFAVLAHSQHHAGWAYLYKRSSLFAVSSEWIYKCIARHRNAAYQLTKALFGATIRPLEYGLTESLFLRLVGVVFLFAFWSLHSQMLGLAGSHGLIPAAQVMQGMRAELGLRAVWIAPSILWLNASDAWIGWTSSLGIVFSLLLIFGGWLGGWVQRGATAVCFVLYLSLVSIAQPFTSFQWDALLLKTAFLALFAGTPLMVWAGRLLAFRLMFESGCVKLLSGDPNWRNLHALRFHFMTQPLPNPVAWYVYQFPGWLLDLLTFLTLAFELGCPWLLFFPRRARHIGATLLIMLQLLIMATGNYAFFNWLTIAICLLAFDDRTLRPLYSILRRSVVTVRSIVARRVSAAILAVLIVLGAVQVLAFFAPYASAPFSPLYRLAASFQVLNSYGLFAVMTTTRPELIYEGSEDGEHWSEYSFPYKPGDVKRVLPMVAPFQPRLDWQLWFAALDGSYEEDRWTGNLAVRLLQGDRAVLNLLEKAPFEQPPKYVRVALYDYWFTDMAERRKTGAVWNRRFEKLYLPAISLDSLRSR